ncbi:hypothetical protein HELRODRAFT_91231 [Helobdella robusta]|uniref:Nuclear pore protein n=1 Tax=Helobdella robusta TaxID=6412 RepID=T1G814_HELRO|nr:hypothetical protein HELRODRAFT_91231 [Helobdella robusta]ESN89906.1 hypothetical protein HELRODRAFT_91231 [Helobdella robusta]
MSTGFDDLLNQTHKLRAEMEIGEDFPRIERNLVQIRDAAFKMATKTPSFNAEKTDIKAALLLSSRGYDVSKSTQKLESLNRTKTFEPLEPIKDVDIQAFLKNEYENAVLTAVEHTKKKTFEEATEAHWEMHEREWEKEKRKIMNSLVDLADENLDFSTVSEQSFSRTMPMDVSCRKVEEQMGDNVIYFVQIQQYNESSMKADARNVLLDAIKKLDDQNLQETWWMVDSLSSITGTSTNKFSSSHRSSPSYQSSLIRQSLSHLEKTNVKQMERLVSMNLQYAQRGGIPGTYNLIKSLFNIKFGAGGRGASYENDLIDGYPAWAFVYHCLRSGDKAAINQVINKSRNVIGDFANYLTEYTSSDDRRLSAGSEREVRLQYRRTISSSKDPYKRIVYCVVGRCDCNDDHADVATTTDDYLWLKLSQVVVALDSNDFSNTVDTLSLGQLQIMLFETYGENHFNASQDPLLYFRILMLVGLFEAAIEFLSRFDVYRDVSVHIAIVMNACNLLLLPANVNSHLLTRDQSDGHPIRRLNFARLIMLYASKFERSNPIKAVHYYYLLNDLTNQEGDNLFDSCISEVVINTREYDLLLGQLQLDGSRKPGLLDQLNVNVNKIIEKVAKELESTGQLNDAVILYDLCKNQTKVIDLLNKLLSQIISSPTRRSSDNIKKIAISVAERLQGSGTASIPNVATFHLLLDLMTFFSYYYENCIEDAYNVIKELKIISLTEDSLEDRLKNVGTLSDEVRRCLPNVLLATATIITQLFNRVIGPIVNDPATSNNLLRRYRYEMHCLVSFCGSMPYRMPADVTARLVQFEASIK